MQRRHHYEAAFEHYLRLGRIPYVAVNEAKKALVPAGVPLPAPGGSALKSFDFVLYGETGNLLVEIKGRRVGRGPRPEGFAPARPAPRGRLESWVTEEDVESLAAWEALFGAGFEAAFVFIYWCDELPARALFEEIVEFRERWYALRAIRLADYRAAMRPRSPKWRTVHLPAAAFDRLSVPLTARADGTDPWSASESFRVSLHPGPAEVASPL